MVEKVKVGINGFGRIGRISLRSSFRKASPVQVVQINDPFMTLENAVALLNYDSAHGRFLGEARIKDDGIVITHSITGETSCHIKLTHEKDPSLINWNLGGAEVVCECTGVFLTTETASKHLAKNNKTSKVDKVVLSAPAKDPSIPLFVLGVNHSSYKGEDIISNASCTTNCLAPLVKAITDRFTLTSGLMTTVHAVTATQPLVDGPNKRSIRTGFSGMHNIIPATTGAASAVGKVLPKVKGIITGMAFRVPVLTGSVVDFTFTLENKEVGLEEVLAGVREAAEKELKGYLRVDDSDSLTSAGIIGDQTSSIVDAKASIDMRGNGDRQIKIVSWYDNEFGYSCRLMELAAFVMKK